MSAPAAPDATTPAAIVAVDQAVAGSPDDKTVISKLAPTSETPLPPLLTPQHLGQALVGKRLDHYELVEFVGGGGMGAVFRSTDTRLGRTVAVKVLSRDQTDDETIRRFRNEAQSAARLDHPNIARVHFVGDDAGWNYIVFEFIDGVNLRDLVDRNGRLSVDDALNYTLQVAEALAHASSRDVVHRDIKPSNVLVTPSGVVKLVDMGLARLHQVESSSDDLTASGVTLGTFDYISPEQARDPRSADVRSDIYSLGCTLYFMLVGQPPFPEGTALQKLLRHNGDDPPDLRSFRPELSPKVSALVARMLAKRPSQRPQTPEVLIQEIVSLGEQLGLDFAGRRNAAWAAPVAPPSIWERIAPIAIPIVVLAVVLVALDALLPPSSSADVSLRPTFSTTPVISPTGDSPRPAPSVADDLQARPINNPDRSLRRDAVSPKADSSKSAAGLREPMEATSIAPALDEDIAPAPTVISKVTPPLENAGTSTERTLLPPTASGLTVSPPGDRVPVSPSNDAGTAPATKTPGSVETKPSVTRLVVRPRSENEIVDGVETVASLSAATRRAAELGVTDIELHFDGDLRERPFEIASSRLNIKAGAGFKPRIVFQPELSTSAEMRQMIRLTSSGPTRLNVTGVMLRLELPPEPSFGWSLFAIQPAQSLDIVDSVLTVQDEGSLGGPVHDQVAVFQVLPRRIGDSMMMDDEPAMAPPVTIGLTRTIVRGEATVVSMPDESPFKLVWNQGLLVTSRRLIETGGTILKPKWFGRVEIDLDHVTVVAQQGLHQMRRRGGAAHQLDVDVRSNRSILHTGPDSAVFEFANVPGVDDIKLTFDGADNCYPRPDVVFVRVKPMDSSEPTEDFDLESRTRWSTERRPDLGVTWKEPAPASLPAHDHTKFHYIQAEGALNDAGFDPALLPDAIRAEDELAPPTAIESPLSDDDDDDPAPAPPAISPSGMVIPAGSSNPAGEGSTEPMSRLNRGGLR